MTAAEIGSLVLAAVYATSAAVKLSGSEPGREIAAKINLSLPLLRVVGGFELLGALGLVAGVVLETWMGVAAAVGFVVLMILGVGAHVRAKEPFAASVPAIVLGAAAAVLVFTL
ncbi:MAG: DoxX family protein [Marmoricola sp.]